MIRNDLHVHSIRSLCGLHTIFEIAQIAASKKMAMVNICDHGWASGGPANFGVFTDKRRFPDLIPSFTGQPIRILRGVEANILGPGGNTDMPIELKGKFDLISAGFHQAGGFSKGSMEKTYTDILIKTALQNPIDILTHPCIKAFPLNISVLVDLALEYGFALELNNTNLRLAKTNLSKFREMISLAVEKKALLVETSDGHTFHEIGENESVEAILQREGINGDEVLLNRQDEKLEQFLAARRDKRR